MPAKRKKPDWAAIRAEYIAGGIGQRKLAEKHGVKYSALRFQADSEGWVEARNQAKQKAIAKTAQKTAEAAATNAATAQRIRAKLLARLEREIDALPEKIGSSNRKSMTSYEYSVTGTAKRPKAVGEISTEYRLRDLTAAWKDLTEGLYITEAPDEKATDDGFLEALSGTAAEDWSNDEE